MSASQDATLVVLAHPIHVVAQSKQQACIGCQSMLWVPPLRDQCNKRIACVECARQSQQDSESSLLLKQAQNLELFRQCVHVLDNVPSLVPPPRWEEILARADMREQPRGETGMASNGCLVYGEWLIHYAAYRRRADVLRLLLKQWPDSVHARTSKQETPLHSVLWEGSRVKIDASAREAATACVRALLEYKAEVDAMVCCIFLRLAFFGCVELCHFLRRTRRWTRR